MHNTRLRRLHVLGLTAGAVIVLAACGGGPASSSGGSPATAQSAADAGGLNALVTAAKKEGKLNVIALPPDWANYGAIISGFTAKYGSRSTRPTPTAAARTRSTRSSSWPAPAGRLTSWTSGWR